MMMDSSCRAAAWTAGTFEVYAATYRTVFKLGLLIYKSRAVSDF